MPLMDAMLEPEPEPEPEPAPAPRPGHAPPGGAAAAGPAAAGAGAGFGSAVGTGFGAKPGGFGAKPGGFGAKPAAGGFGAKSAAGGFGAKPAGALGGGGGFGKLAGGGFGKPAGGRVRAPKSARSISDLKSLVLRFACFLAWRVLIVVFSRGAPHTAIDTNADKTLQLGEIVGALTNATKIGELLRFASSANITSGDIDRDWHVGQKDLSVLLAILQVDVNEDGARSWMEVVSPHHWIINDWLGFASCVWFGFCFLDWSLGVLNPGFGPTFATSLLRACIDLCFLCFFDLIILVSKALRKPFHGSLMKKEVKRSQVKRTRKIRALIEAGNVHNVKALSSVEKAAATQYKPGDCALHAAGVPHNVLNVLFLPVDTQHNKEGELYHATMASVQDLLRGCEHIATDFCMGAKASTIQTVLKTSFARNDGAGPHVLHWHGHGSKDTLGFADRSAHIVPAIRNSTNCPNLHGVVLCACNSTKQAKELLKMEDEDGERVLGFVIGTA